MLHCFGFVLRNAHCFQPLVWYRPRPIRTDAGPSGPGLPACCISGCRPNLSGLCSLHAQKRNEKNSLLSWILLPFLYLSFPLPCPRESAPLEQGARSLIHSFTGWRPRPAAPGPSPRGSPTARRPGRADPFPTGPPAAKREAR